MVKVINRFKELDLVDRVPEELWMEVCNTVQEAVTKTIPKKKKCKKAKWLSRRHYKAMWEERKRGKIHPTGCRVPEDSKEREEGLLQRTEDNNRMRKTRDLFKNTGDIKETLHARMGTIEDRNGKDLTEAEEIKKRWQEYTELYKKKS